MALIWAGCTRHAEATTPSRIRRKRGFGRRANCCALAAAFFAGLGVLASVGFPGATAVTVAFSPFPVATTAACGGWNVLLRSGVLRCAGSCRQGMLKTLAK